MLRALMVTAVVLLPVTASAAEIAPELWDRPRSAQAVLAQPVVRKAVADYQARAAARIVIIHGSRQEAQAQAEELRAWLVALSVDSARLQLRADPAATVLRIEVME